ncbi:phage tail tape measure protein [Acidipropionibacterium jensenii]|uniref:phage tail tape measure protein n=1 Tax=Acidipropionibacterium jensenii TaxID=1749 RepID=UPI00041B8B89|nr:phage tail tape measure protein [Acidipropionibacterium jensenii]
MTELAQGYLSLSVGLDHPGASVAKWLSTQQKAVDVAGKAMGKSLSGGLNLGAERAKADAEQAKRAFDIAAKAATAASEKQEAAARKVQIAEAKLNETREKYAKDSSQVLTAEDRLATAKGAAAKASLSVTAAEAKQATAADKVKVALAEQTVATGKAATESERSAGKIRTAFSKIGAKIPNPFRQLPPDAQKAGVEAGARFGRGFTAAEKSTGRLSTAFSGLGTKAKGMGSTLMSSLGMVLPVASGAAGGVMAAGAAVAATAKAGMDLESALSKVKATGGVTASQMGQLKTQALSMGKTFGMSGTEATGAVEALIKAGVSAKDVVGGGLSGALSLAAAGEMDVGEAAETASSAMAQFGLKGQDVGHIADVLSQGANLAQGSVSDLSQALSQGGMVASQMGMSLDETVGTLAEFANKGLMGSDAGTSLKSMLQRLSNPTKQASNAMKSIGLNAYNAQGKFVGLSSIAGQLQSGLGKLTQKQRDSALATIFGADAVRAASILYKDGAKGVSGWTKGVGKAGAAMATARTNTDNLKGDIAKFKAVWTNSFAQIGGSSQGPLRDVVQFFTKIGDVLPGVVGKIGEFTSAVWKISPLKTLLDDVRGKVSLVKEAFDIAGKSATLETGDTKGWDSVLDRFNRLPKSMQDATQALIQFRQSFKAPDRDNAATQGAAGLGARAGAAARTAGDTFNVAKQALSLKTGDTKGWDQVFDKWSKLPKAGQGIVTVALKARDAMKEFGSQAKAAISSGWKDMLDQAGPGMKDAWQSIKDLFSSIGDVWKNVIGPNLKKTEPFWDKLAKIAKDRAFQSLKDTFRLLGDALNIIGKTIGLVVDGIKLFVDLFKGLSGQGWGDFGKDFKKIGGDLTGIVGGIGKMITDAFAGLGHMAIDGFVKGGSEKITQIRDKVDHWFDSVVGWVKNKLGIHSPSTVFASIGSWSIQGFIVGMQGLFGSVTSRIGGFFTGLGGRMRGWASAGWTKVGGAFSRGWTSVVQGLARFGTRMSRFWGSARATAGRIAGSLWTSVRGVFSRGWTSVTTGLASAFHR